MYRSVGQNQAEQNSNYFPNIYQILAKTSDSYAQDNIQNKQNQQVINNHAYFKSHKIISEEVITIKMMEQVDKVHMENNFYNHQNQSKNSQQNSKNSQRIKCGQFQWLKIKTEKQIVYFKQIINGLKSQRNNWYHLGMHVNKFHFKYLKLYANRPAMKIKSQKYRQLFINAGKCDIIKLFYSSYFINFQYTSLQQFMKSQKLKQIISQGGNKIQTWKAQLLLAIAILSALYIIFSLFDVSVIITFMIFVASVSTLCTLKWQKLKAKGLINMVSPSMKKTLTERSIMDIYRDAIYFPTITRIIGAFISGAISKPHPDKINTVFEQLDPNFQKIINTKGILHLAPSKVEKLILENDQESKQQLALALNANESSQQNRFKKLKNVPDFYGQVDPKWDNIEKYEKQQVKVHEIKLHHSVLENLGNQIQWKHIVVLASLVGYGLMKTKSKKMAKIFLYNGSAAGIMIVAILALIKYQKSGKARPKNSISRIIEQKISQV